MRSNVPVVPPSVYHASIPLTVKLILRLAKRLASGRDRILVNCVHVGNIKVQRHRPRPPLAVRFAAFDHGILYAHFRVTGGSVRSFLLEYDLRRESFHEEGQKLRCSFHTDPRRHAAQPLRYEMPSG